MDRKDWRRMVEISRSDGPLEELDLPRRAYAGLSSLVLADHPIGETLTRIALLALETIDGADDASVTLLEHGRPRSAAFAGDSNLAAALDERQYDSGFGPCLDAAATGRTIAVKDTSQEDAYPEFAAEAARRGVRHTLAVGMPTLHEVTGALNIYSRGVNGPFSDQAVATATGFAGYAAVALTNASLYAGALDQVVQMQEAMASRAVIEQAKGIIMRDTGGSESQAFEVLREASMRSNRKLRDVAVSLVEGTVRAKS